MYKIKNNSSKIKYKFVFEKSLSKKGLQNSWSMS